MLKSQTKPLNIREKLKLMLQINNELLHFKESPLALLRKSNQTYPVIGEGSLCAGIILIGEAPGKKESETRKPFCGASGKVLDVLLSSAGLVRDDVFVTSIIKDRPPENRDPSPVEIEAYAPFLDRQLDIIEPRVIATLGRFSMKYIMEKFGLASELKPISKLHGKVFKSKASYGDIYIVPLYHPAVAVYNSNTRNQLIKDFKILPTLI